MRKSKRSRLSSQPALAIPPPLESRAVVAVTVGWMLTTLCSLAAELAALLALAVAQLGTSDANGPQLPAVAAGALLLTALVTGLLSLVLTVVVWRLRSVKPPVALVWSAIAIGLLPLVTWIAVTCAGSSVPPAAPRNAVDSYSADAN